MTKRLFLVESPKKKKTIQSYLDNTYTVEATFGHFMKLRRTKEDPFGIDRKTIEGTYDVEKTEVYNTLLKLVKQADEVVIASDLDTEGEAIAWEVKEFLKIPDDKYIRITYAAITKAEITNALNNPQKIDMNVVRSQFGRSYLDKIVGFELSPVVWKAMNNHKLSAGRVQSIVLKMIVDRQISIDSFIPEEYWKISTELGSGGTPLVASLKTINGTKAEVGCKSEADAIKVNLDASTYVVSDILKKPKKQNATAPFTTTSYQSGCGSKLKMTPVTAMKVAQVLYEKGLITYHRTDSTSVESVFQKNTAAYIKSTYGEKYTPRVPNAFKTKQKNAQEAHECIRPNYLTTEYEPSNVRTKMAKEGVDAKILDLCERAYKLIWNKYISSQMTPAEFDTTSIKIMASNGDWKAQLGLAGRIETFSGYLSVYKESDDNDTSNEKADKEIEGDLPPINKDDSLSFIKTTSSQKFTSPPPYFNGASLVVEMEKRGIGRPSTTAGMIQSVQTRGYAQVVGGKFKPTDLGVSVEKVLSANFKDIMDYDFTRKMEDNLDDISSGKIEYKKFVKDHWDRIEAAALGAKKAFGAQSEETNESCPICSGKLLKITQGEKSWLACENREKKTCKFTRSVDVEVHKSKKCPDCSSDLYLKTAKVSKQKFWSCCRYPVCNFIESAEPKVIHPTEKCGDCGSELSKRKGKFGDFWSCSDYPKCKFILQNKETHPTEKCGDCGSELSKRKGKFGDFWSCSDYPKCKFILKEKKDGTQKSRITKRKR